MNGLSCCASRCPSYGLDDALIRPATAQRPRHGRDDLLIARVWILFEQGCGCHDLSGLTIATLRNTFRNPCSLQGVTAVLGESFDGHDPFAADRGYGYLAGMDCLALQVHSTSAAKASSTTVFRSY